MRYGRIWFYIHILEGGEIHTRFNDQFNDRYCILVKLHLYVVIVAAKQTKKKKKKKKSIYPQFG